MHRSRKNNLNIYTATNPFAPVAFILKYRDVNLPKLNNKPLYTFENIQQRPVLSLNLVDFRPTNALFLVQVASSVKFKMYPFMICAVFVVMLA